MGDYTDTQTVGMSQDNLDLTELPLVTMEIFTSHAHLAGTNDTILATFLGIFSVSGPHQINPNGPLIGGRRLDLNVTIDRDIGELKQVRLENMGRDGWLLSELKCIIDDKSYTLKGPRQWLDSTESDQQRGFTNGREPDVQELVPAAPKLTWSVTDVIRLYKPSGSRNTRM